MRDVFSFTLPPGVMRKCERRLRATVPKDLVSLMGDPFTATVYKCAWGIPIKADIKPSIISRWAGLI